MTTSTSGACSRTRRSGKRRPKMQDAERFERKLLETCTVYGRQLETQLFDAWWRACANLSDETFERAVDEAVKECTHFPTPAQVRAISYRLHEERDQRRGEES